MSQQSTLTDENFYPVVDEEKSTDETAALYWDPNQALVCGKCGCAMKRGATGARIGDYTTINYSCRNSSCGGSSTAGGSALNVLVKPVVVVEDGEKTTKFEVEDDTTIGTPLKRSASEFYDHPEYGKPVHQTLFDVEKWADLDEEQEDEKDQI